MNKKANGWMIAGITIGVIFLLGLMFFGWIAGTYNTLVSADTSTEASWAKVQTAYQRRADLIPNLVNTVKGYSDYEGDIQKSVAQFRSGIMAAKNPSELNSVGKEMNSLISNLIVSVEAYPNLKANENYLALQDELAGTENRIKWERDNYNDAVKEYKLTVRRFPSSIIASMFNFDNDKWNMFEAEEGSDEVPVVSFE